MPGSINRSFALAVACTALSAAPALAQDKSRSPAPASNPGMWFTDDDYPPAAKRAGQEGRVVLELSIDATGAPIRCRPAESSGSAALDEASCSLVLERGRFTPALDAVGKPVAGTYKFSTRWVLRDSVPDLTGPWRSARMFSIDATGKILSCVDQSSGDLGGLNIAPCAAYAGMPLAAGLVARDRDPRPGAIDVTMEMAMNFDGDRPLPMVYESPARIVSSLILLQFDVGKDGKVTNCKATLKAGWPNGGNPCAQPPGPFLPQPEKRSVTWRIATSRPAGG